MSKMIDRVVKALNDEAACWRMVDVGHDFYAMRQDRLPFVVPPNTSVSAPTLPRQYLGPSRDTAKELFNFLVTEACARAAIEAMREPTEAMRTAKVKNSYDEVGTPMNEKGALDNTNAAWIWQAMIDAALK